jgi:hypothetical protein
LLSIQRFLIRYIADRQQICSENFSNGKTRQAFACNVSEIVPVSTIRDHHPWFSCTSLAISFGGTKYQQCGQNEINFKNIRSHLKFPELVNKKLEVQCHPLESRINFLFVKEHEFPKHLKEISLQNYENSTEREECTEICKSYTAPTAAMFN